MTAHDPEKEHIESLTAMAIGFAMKTGAPKESPGLDRRFRCPSDGSTNTQAIQEILDASVTSLEINGKQVSAVVDTPLLKRYRIGPRPRIRYEFLLLSMFFLSLVLLPFGMWNGSMVLLQAVVMLVSSAITFIIFWLSKRQLPDEIAKRAEREYTAKNKWHCHQCGRPFLPKPPNIGPFSSELQELEPVQFEEPSSTAENVSPLARALLGTEKL